MRDRRREQREFRVAFVIGLPVFLLLRWAVVRWTALRPVPTVIFCSLTAAFVAWIGVNVVRRVRPAWFEPPRT